MNDRLKYCKKTLEGKGLRNSISEIEYIEYDFEKRNIEK